MELREELARLFYDTATAKARGESANVVPWEKVTPYWRQVHLVIADAVLDRFDLRRKGEAPTIQIHIDEPRCMACGQLGHNCPTGGRILR